MPAQSPDEAGLVPSPDEAGALRVAVLGPGGVGGLLAGLLAVAGDSVTCLAGAGTVATLRERGLRISSERFGELSVPVAAAERLDDPVDVCLVTVKSTQLTQALDRVPPQVLAEALLVPFLNGVEHVDELRRRYPAASVVAATIRVESTRTSLGQIRHDSPFASVELAALPAAREPVERLARHLEGTGLDVTMGASETGVLWDKLCFLAPLAVLTTYAQAPVGVVREQHRADLEAVVAEVAAVAGAEGTPADAHRVLALFDTIPASMQSSMQRDAAGGRETELDAIAGAVLRAADRRGVPVPVTSRLVGELRGRLESRGLPS